MRHKDHRRRGVVLEDEPNEAKWFDLGHSAGLAVAIDIVERVLHRGPRSEQREKTLLEVYDLLWQAKDRGSSELRWNPHDITRSAAVHGELVHRNPN